MPSLYAILADQTTGEGINPLFCDHVTMGGRLPSVEKMLKKDFFNSWGSTYPNALSQDRQKMEALASRYKNYIFTSENMEILKDFNEQKEMFPMWNELRF